MSDLFTDDDMSKDGYPVIPCRCPEGPYLGARISGTPCCCERCGFMTQEQIDYIAARAQVAELGRLVTLFDELDMPEASAACLVRITAHFAEMEAQ